MRRDGQGGAAVTFAARFAGVEALAADRGVDMKTASIEELDAIWEEVKKTEPSHNS